MLALTFDDGPNPAATPALLALLARHEVRASFFLVGQFARACPQVVRDIAARGHTIGNHTETHPNLFRMTHKAIERELTQCQESIEWAMAGMRPRVPVWMRPPFGYRGPQISSAVRGAGLRGIVMWSRACKDWKPQTPEGLIERLGRISAMPDSGPGAEQGRGEVLLLHDGDFRRNGSERGNLLHALGYWLPRWREAGVNFVTIDEIASATARK